MPKIQQKTLISSILREAGWKALVKSIGLVCSTRFLLQYESSYGDYTKIKKGLYSGKNVGDILKEIKQSETYNIKKE